MRRGAVISRQPGIGANFAQDLSFLAVEKRRCRVARNNESEIFSLFLIWLVRDVDRFGTFIRARGE